jgi:hypothetical protein
MHKPMVWAILETPPNAAWPNGFSPRWEAFLHALQDSFAVELFAIRQPDSPWRVEDFTGEALSAFPVTVEDAGFNPLNRPGAIGRLRRLRHYASGRLPHMSHPRRFPILESRLGDEEPALVLSFLPSTAQVMERLPKHIPVIALIEEGWDRALEMSVQGRGRHAWAARRGAIMLQNLYRRIGELGHTIVVISREEHDWFSRFAPRERIVCIPHAIDCSYFTAHAGKPDIDVAVFGDLSQARNYVPARKLYDTLSRQATTHGPLTWAFVGRNPHASISSLSSGNVTVTGFVPDMREWYDRARVVVAPTRSGAGVKTTVLQALAMERPVVATPFSATGLDVTAGRDLLIGETDDELATHVLNLLADSPRARTLAVNGRDAVRSHHDIRSITRMFAELCQDRCLAQAISEDQTEPVIPEGIETALP